MSGGLMQLIAYGGFCHDFNWHSLYRRFEVNQTVSLSEYLKFIEGKIYSDVNLRVQIEKWEKDKIRIVLLLRKKFELETKSKWKQFSSFVLRSFVFPPKPSEDNYVDNIKNKTNLSKFYFKHFKHIHHDDIKNCLENEPVLTRKYIHDFIGYVLQYYKTHGKCYKYPLDLVSIKSLDSPGKKMWIKQNIQHQKILQFIKKEKRQHRHFK